MLAKKSLTIALFPNLSKREPKNIAVGIREFLTSHGVKVLAEDEIAQEIGAEKLSSTKPKAIDFMVSLGGDGTILNLVHGHPELDAPILGINMGGLGFMADIPITDIYPSLQDLIEGNYTIQTRLMMEGHTEKDDHCLALNEMVVHRAKNPCLVDLALHVDGQYLNTFSADGVIVATPSGSTAYSLAAGGPILYPDLNALVITPISPHTISNRPIVLMPQKEVQIQFLSNVDPVEVAFDGYTRFTISTGEVFHINVSKKKFRLVLFPRHDYFHTLRAKMGWAGKLRI